MRRADQRRDAVFALYQAELTGRAVSELLDRNASSFTRDLVQNAWAWREHADATIAMHAKGWSIDRIAPLELSIMRVALFEVSERTDVPDEVAIDQAVELAKQFCSAEAPGFVNGILATALRASQVDQPTDGSATTQGDSE